VFSGKINCLILAGQRSGDPLSEYFHLPNKAFIPLLGKPLIEWVLDALDQSNCFRAPIISVSSSQENLFVEKLKDHEYKLLSLPENSSRLDGVFRCLKSFDS
jgi:molybdopterin-guanine dinucleotide biosynthesis protein A